MTERYAFSNSISSEDVKRTRELLKMTQQQFADFLNVSRKTVEHWEAKDTITKGAIVPFLRMIRENPMLPELYAIPPMVTPLRISYFFRNDLCTIIDVNERDQYVSIKNYTNKRLFRAFGVNTEPTYEEYEEFLESRCFPRGRDKMKIELQRLGLPFYDPLLIISKTEGRMAEDEFWIKIERM